MEKQHEIGVSLDVLIVVPGETIEEAIKNMQELSKEELLKNAINHLPFEGALSINWVFRNVNIKIICIDNPAELY
mgnify:CR=1 FL=1